MPPVHHRRLEPSRDALTTVADDGSRVALHPADVRGRFTFWRRASAVLLIAIYVLLPWIPVGGHPAVFFDVVALRFHLFGLTLAPQDFWLIFFLISGLGFTLFYVTALFGRLWCGWACPQTIFLEHVYRRIERLLEGDAARRRQLDRAPLSGGKMFRRGLKHALFVLVSLVIAHVLLAYFVSLPHVWQMITHAPTEHWGVFIAIIVTTGFLYFNFAWFREQLCIILCPYGRLQSVLIDDHSTTIGYDAIRGEPRGRAQRSEVRGLASEVRDLASETDAPSSEPTSDLRPPTSTRASGPGDCIDCFRCVQVCPTGIDIRQGLQMECIGCAACVDACDEVMMRLERPRGLVRYDSMNGLAGRKTRFLRPRILLYSALLLVGAAVAGFSISRYQPAGISIVRMTGASYYVDEAYVRNQFFLRVTNQQAGPATFSVRLVPGPGAPAGWAQRGWEDPVEVAADADDRRPLVLLVPRGAYAGKFAFRIEVVVASGGLTLTRDAEFVGPDPQLLHSHGQPAP